MSKFIVPTPMILKGKLREIVNLEKLTTFTYMKATNEHYGYIKFCFDKGNDHTWIYTDDAAMKNDLHLIYDKLEIAWDESQF
ncbi:hypothetical protein F0919_16160 [Taibaiella lutea]|uniref:Uncharacterized protein n=1 Tax=Taibaiella lutea TaxID=2608001 RepID=A0A5M6CAX7_9BACT|nr:hypothetical protein [Taibaiella lutea]KAA5532327.1 hypothetical protein F0919_16160 [Taibaiella lutea]